MRPGLNGCSRPTSTNSVPPEARSDTKEWLSGWPHPQTLTASRSPSRTCGDGCWQRASLWSSTPPGTMAGDSNAPRCGAAPHPAAGRYSATKALSPPADKDEYWLPQVGALMCRAAGTWTGGQAGLLPDASRTLASPPDSGPYRQVGLSPATVDVARPEIESFTAQ